MRCLFTECMNSSKGFEIEVGEGILREVFHEFGFEGLVPNSLASFNGIDVGIISVWNQNDWARICSNLGNKSSQVLILTDCESEIEFAKDWIIVETPILLEPLFYDLELFRKTGELPIFSQNIERGITTLRDIFSYLETQELNSGKRFSIYSNPIDSLELSSRISGMLSTITDREMIASVLFNDIDQDRSGFIESDELISISSKFTDMDVQEFISKLDRDDDNRLDVNEFDMLMSNEIVDFVKSSIPDVHFRLKNKSEAEDMLTSYGYSITQSELLFASFGSTRLENYHAINSDFKDWLIHNACTILGVRIIPSVGILRTQSIRIQNQPGTHLVMFRPNDCNIRIRRNLDGRYLQATVDNSDSVRDYSWRKGSRKYSISTNESGQIVAMSGKGVWKEQSNVLKAMIQGKVVSNSEIENFQLTGGLESEQSNANQMVCRCVDLAYSTVEDLIISGVDNIATLKKQTGATTVCGGCTSVVENMLENRVQTEIKRFGTMEVPVIEVSSFDSQPTKEIGKEAESFILQMIAEGANNMSRLEEVKNQILETGTWIPNYQELEWGARVSWRNSTRCVGRYFWETLAVKDARHLTEPDEIFEAMFDHIKWATNGGEIRACMTVFRQADSDGIGPRLWNDQYIRYACHELENGRTLGDPATRTLTRRIKELGWNVENPTNFDILPLVLEWPGQSPIMREIPEEIILQVKIRHPDMPGLENMYLQWYALPAVSAMSLEIGGLLYTLAPFNGFYMSTEIGARNFTDQDRYNLIEDIAASMGITNMTNRELWKDKVQVDLNRAILHSFEKDGVRMMDHHTLSEWFLKFEKNEKEAGRDVHAEWAWIVPPIGASATPLYLCDHWENKILKPNLFYLPEIHETKSKMGHGTPAKDSQSRCPFSGNKKS